MKPGKLTNLIITVSCLAAATVLAFLFFYFVPNNGSNIALIYILALIIIVRFTDGYLPGVFSSVIAVICVNFLFTYPYFALNFTLAGYPITFLEMLAVTLFTSKMTTNMKEQAKLIAERDKLLSEAEKEKMRANLLRAVSHDLRTPLTGIIGASSSYLENGASLTDGEKTPSSRTYRKTRICNFIMTALKSNDYKVTYALNAEPQYIFTEIGIGYRMIDNENQ